MESSDEPAAQSPFWTAVYASFNFIGSFVPVWLFVVIVLLVVVLLAFSVWVYCKYGKQVPPVKAPKPAAKISKANVAPLDTAHLLEYPGSIYAYNVQPDGSDLEGHRSGSLSTMREKRFLGSIKYSVLYDATKSELKVAVHQAADLSLALPGDTLNPFCRVYLFPETDRKARVETAVQNASTNPVFNQECTFQVSIADMLLKTLVVAILNAEGPDKVTTIGQVRLAVGTLDPDKPIVDEWRDLELIREAEDDENNHGDVCICLRYVPTTTKLTVTVLECKNLRRKLDSSKPIDPFLKVKLKYKEKLLKTRQTSVKKRTRNPYYNEEFNFPILPETIVKCHLVITVYAYEGVVGSRKIGRAILGSHVMGTGAQHWNDMLSSPRKPIVQWHSLESERR